MIEIIDYKLFNNKGILIKYDTDKDIFFTEEEMEKIRTFLNNRGIGNRILKTLEDEDSTIEEIAMKLGLNVRNIRNEVIRLIDEGQVLVTNENRAVHHQDFGLIFLPIYKRNQDECGKHE